MTGKGKDTAEQHLNVFSKTAFAENEIGRWQHVGAALKEWLRQNNREIDGGYDD